MTGTEQISGWLADEESRFIYKKRVEYNETGNFKAIWEIVDAYLPELKSRGYYPGIEIELVKKVKNKKKIAVFGLGYQGCSVIELLQKAGITVAAAYDNNAAMWGRTFHDIPVSEPAKEDCSVFDTIIISPYNNEWVQAIKNQLAGYGVGEDKIVFYKDYLPYMLEEEQYFDEKIIKLEDKEVFIDAGVLDLETSLNFCNICKKRGVKNYRVHAYEPDNKSFDRCREIVKKYPEYDISLYHAGLWKENTTLCFDMRGDGASRITENSQKETVSMVALDKSIDDKVTFIKMDIEGAEFAALRGAKNIIQTQKPKLAICIYHKKEDLTEIPMYIKELVPEYKLYIRHYSDSAGETVLYAIP